MPNVRCRLRIPTDNTECYRVSILHTLLELLSRHSWGAVRRYKWKKWSKKLNQRRQMVSATCSLVPRILCGTRHIYTCYILWSSSVSSQQSASGLGSLCGEPCWRKWGCNLTSSRNLFDKRCFPPRYTVEIIPLCIGCDHLWCCWFLQWP